MSVEPQTATPDSDTTPKDAPHASRFLALLVGSIGIVYGDIGTSPLYAFREAVHAVSRDGVMDHEIYGVLSLIIWALFLVVTVKYVFCLLRADNNGEGGILSLAALLGKTGKLHSGLLFLAGAAGCALFYGDAAITPAISVLSAVEGLHLVTPAFDHAVLPLTMLILLLLFIGQKAGTSRVSAVFGPIMIIWFLALGITGLYWVCQHPAILQSFSPHFALLFLKEHAGLALAVLGAVFLAVTGAEALYADLGHFGRKPIQAAWLLFVFPCLILNYLGQGALVLEHPATFHNPFYLMVPEWALIPMVVLATAAAIIAGQAVITGAFSLTRQAIQLGFLPRMEIRHTSADQHGQIYIPQVNLYLLVLVLLLCISFGTSSGLASAYGIAVIGTMIVSTLLMVGFGVLIWKKSLMLTLLVALPFLIIEAVFFTANIMKIGQGGFVPLVFAAGIMLLMWIWVKGTRYLAKHARRNSVRIGDLGKVLERQPLHQVPGTAIFLTSDTTAVPQALIQNLKHNHVYHAHNIILTITTATTPKVANAERIKTHPLLPGFVRMEVSFGFMEKSDIRLALNQARASGIEIDPQQTTFFLGRRKIVSDPYHGLPAWQDHIYIALSHAAVDATDFYNLPRRQVIEMGVQVAV